MSSFGPKMTDRLADYEIADAADPIAVASQSGVAPMSTFQADSAETDGMSVTGNAPAPVSPIGDIRVQGKFFFAGENKHFVKGVTFGPFAVGSHGAQFPEHDVVAKDFAMIAAAGINTVRVFTVPPLWLLDAAGSTGLKVLVGLPWSQHVAFLDSTTTQAQIRAAVAGGVRACARHPAIFAYLVGNEIPPDMVRWHGAEPVFLRAWLSWSKPNTPGALAATPISPRPNI